MHEIKEIVVIFGERKAVLWNHKRSSHHQRRDATGELAPVSTSNVKGLHGGFLNPCGGISESW